MKGWTYGAELEYGDLDRREKKLPEGCKWDERDFTMVNSNGVAVDPKGRLYPFGGEINTAPTDTIEAQVAQFRKLLKLFPEAACNYRSNLHIHIRVPNLRDDLSKLKRIQSYVESELRWHINAIEPIPKPTTENYPDEESYQGAMKRYHRRIRSHHTFIPGMRVVQQMQAKNLEAFLSAECPRDSKGAVMWHAQPRAAVNLRQLRETDTIEFRHFPGTLNPHEFESALEWCRIFLTQAMGDQEKLFYVMQRELPKLQLPHFQPYVHWMELRYQTTIHDGTWKPKQIQEHLNYILGQDRKFEPCEF